MKLIDTNRCYLQVKGIDGVLALSRFLHKATVVDGNHTYIFFIDCITGQAYIEEIDPVEGLKRIESDELVEEITAFLDSHGLRRIPNNNQ